MELLKYPDKRLEIMCNEVHIVNDDIHKQIDDMFELLYSLGNGLGLAAPQVGILNRILIVDLKAPYPEEMNAPLVMINPVITHDLDGTCCMNEGCLSFPGAFALIHRPKSIIVDFTAADGYKVTMTFDGLMSRCIQHEIDHLNGLLFTRLAKKGVRRAIERNVRKMK